MPVLRLGLFEKTKTFISLTLIDLLDFVDNDNKKSIP